MEGFIMIATVDVEFKGYVNEGTKEEFRKWLFTQRGILAYEPYTEVEQKCLANPSGPTGHFGSYMKASGLPNFSRKSTLLINPRYNPKTETIIYECDDDQCIDDKHKLRISVGGIGIKSNVTGDYKAVIITTPFRIVIVEKE
jgi:hypothetical protein